MKNLIIISSVMLSCSLFTACDGTNKPSSISFVKDSTNRKSSSAAAKSGINRKVTESITGLMNNYLQLKNALTKDDSNDAATAGSELANGFVKFDRSTLTASQKKSFEDIADDAKEMAEHIGKSAGNIRHQREHFDMLSKDMYDLVKLLGTGQSLYVDHCPMYNDKKGAIWLSENKEIKNPYMGSNMSTCGTVKEELNK